MDEFYCTMCDYVYHKEDVCPFCNVRLVRLDEGLDEFNYSTDEFEEDLGSNNEFGTEELSGVI